MNNTLMAPDQSALKSIASYTKNPAFSDYGKYDEIKEIIHKIPKDHIVLGSFDREFSTGGWYLPYSKADSIICFGSKGSGKTNLMELMLWQRYYRFGSPSLIVDPKQEYYAAQAPRNDPASRTKLKKFNLAPKGLPIFLATPSYVVEDDDLVNNGFVYTLELSDFKRIRRRGEREWTLLSFFNLSPQDSTPAKLALQRWLNRLPDKFIDFERALATESKQVSTYGETVRRNSFKLLDAIVSARLSGSIGKGEHIYFPSIMQHQDGTIGEIPVIQMTIEGSNDYTTSNYLALAINQIINDRRRAKKGYKAFLSSPPTIVVDEVDVYAPRLGGMPSKAVLESIPTKYRVWEVSSIQATQKPTFVSEKLISDVDYLFTPKLQTSGEKQALRGRGLDEFDINKIFNRMYFNKFDPVKQFALLKPQGDYETGYILNSPCGML